MITHSIATKPTLLPPLLQLFEWPLLIVFGPGQELRLDAQPGADETRGSTYLASDLYDDVILSAGIFLSDLADARCFPEMTRRFEREQARAKGDDIERGSYR
jgi:hypothetical protein